MANVVQAMTFFETRFIDVSNHHLQLARVAPPKCRSQKAITFRTKRRNKQTRTDFGQSNFALSNVRALRAIIMKAIPVRFSSDDWAFDTTRVNCSVRYQKTYNIIARSALTFESAKLD